MRLFFSASLHSILFVLLTTLIAACSDNNELSESERRYNAAMALHAERIAETRALLDEKLTGQFLSDINTLIYAKEKLDSAASVFIEAKIVGITSSDAQALELRLKQFEKQAAKSSILLLRSAFDKTLKFQNSVHDMPLAPVSGASVKSNSMIEYMGKKFNTSLDDCCLKDLKNIEVFMRGAEGELFYALRKRILNVENDLTRVLSDDDYRSNYKKRLTELENDMNAYFQP
ncbi:hypothetical protein [Alteromonas sp. P256]|uniref:hypothetical protein n=1 Tax=Alteromonas sp. P256 TaxID=3117399 RepID=UPI002FE41FEF